MRTSFVLAAMILSGCGGAKVEPAAPEEAPPDAAVDAGPPVDAAPAASGPFACRIAGSTCTEYRDAPEDRAEELRAQCAKAGGETLSACPTDKLAATCTVTKPPMTVVSSLYRANDAKKTRNVLAGAKRSCEANGGTFHAAKR
jgi:hypothetical protein